VVLLTQKNLKVFNIRGRFDEIQPLKISSAACPKTGPLVARAISRMNALDEFLGKQQNGGDNKKRTQLLSSCIGATKRALLFTDKFMQTAKRQRPCALAQRC